MEGGQNAGSDMKDRGVQYDDITTLFQADKLRVKVDNPVCIYGGSETDGS